MFCSVKSRFSLTCELILFQGYLYWVRVRIPPEFRLGVSEEAVVTHFLTSPSRTYHILQPHTSPNRFWHYLTARRLFTFRAPGGYH